MLSLCVGDVKLRVGISRSVYKAGRTEARTRQQLIYICLGLEPVPQNLTSFLCILASQMGHYMVLVISTPVLYTSMHACQSRSMKIPNQLHTFTREISPEHLIPSVVPAP